MIKFENIEIGGWEYAVKTMRNRVTPGEESDSEREYENIRDSIGTFVIGQNDHALMMRFVDDRIHIKWRQMIAVYVDITAPLYWWERFDSYEVGTVEKSFEIMGDITKKEFTREDFSNEHLLYMEPIPGRNYSALGMLDATISDLNMFRKLYLETQKKRYWWQIIELLPSSYNQKRTVKTNYDALAHIYYDCKNHKLDEWREFYWWIENLPYSEIITGDRKGERI